MRAANDQNLFRRSIEHEIERLISLLDGIDGDPDIEANGDELDVGMPEGWRPSRAASETILEDDEDGADDEPEESDENGDEQDSSFCEDDHTGVAWFPPSSLAGGSGL